MHTVSTDHAVEHPADIPRLILFAPSVHTGGGLVILKSILAVEGLPPTVLFADVRAIEELRASAASGRTMVIGVRPKALDRMHAQWLLRQRSRQGDTVLCLQGLPPLLPSAARVHVFQQNRLLIGREKTAGYPLRARLQIALGRFLGRALRHRVHTWFVQSPSMRNALEDWLGPEIEVTVLPFADENTVRQSCGSSKGDDRMPPADGHRGERRWDFVYVSDGMPHKNHRRLVEAWQLLADSGIRPSLALTLSSRDAALAKWVAARSAAHGLRIRDLGQLPHEQVLALYRSAGALIYPSLTESFGLPLVEASRCGVPIVASERDYVRDVCEPVHTFDPLSAVSIARAARRALGVPEVPMTVRSAADFIDAVLR